MTDGHRLGNVKYFRHVEHYWVNNYHREWEITQEKDQQRDYLNASLTMVCKCPL